MRHFLIAGYAALVLASVAASAQTVDMKSALVELSVFTIDGAKTGNVRCVLRNDKGAVVSIVVKTGGFLGFGGKYVAIPEEKFVQRGLNIQLALTANEVSKLPDRGIC